ncbi:hypothetical protein SEVIR_9G480850v4 [Setaria viridis]
MAGAAAAGEASFGMDWGQIICVRPGIRRRAEPMGTVRLWRAGAVDPAKGHGSCCSAIPSIAGDGGGLSRRRVVATGIQHRCRTPGSSTSTAPQGSGLAVAVLLAHRRLERRLHPPCLCPHRPPLLPKPPPPPMPPRRCLRLMAGEVKKGRGED